MEESPLHEIIKCLKYIAGILRDNAANALMELRSVSSYFDNQIPYRDGNILRVTEYSVQIGRQLGLGEEQMVVLETAALLHDCGKIGIDEPILAKPGKLTPAKRKEIEMHPMRAYHILSGFPEFISEIQKGADRMNHIIDDILSFARSKELDLMAIDLKKLTKEVVHPFNVNIEITGIDHAGDDASPVQ